MHTVRLPDCKFPVLVFEHFPKQHLEIFLIFKIFLNLFQDPVAQGFYEILLLINCGGAVLCLGAKTEM